MQVAGMEPVDNAPGSFSCKSACSPPIVQAPTRLHSLRLAASRGHKVVRRVWNGNPPGDTKFFARSYPIYVSGERDIAGVGGRLVGTRSVDIDETATSLAGGGGAGLREELPEDAF